MLQYDEAVQVRRGPATGGAAGGSGAGGSGDVLGAPEQFLWRGRLWRVCAVREHWVESADWWQAGDAAGWGPDRAVYRVEAGAGRHGRRETFDLAFDAASGRWQLERVTGR
ncbi:MAG TPA: DUF6504 family protein [Kribbellaceae bacterium]|jgi:hypothetical protein